MGYGGLLTMRVCKNLILRSIAKRCVSKDEGHCGRLLPLSPLFAGRGIRSEWGVE
jgi:hypothetical protein